MSRSSGEKERESSREAVRAVETAQKLLARRQHTRWELRRKLLRRGFGAAAAENAVEQAEAAGWLNDRETAMQLLEEQTRRGGHGRSWIFGKLVSKGIERSLAREIIEEHWNDERERGEIIRFLSRSGSWRDGVFSDRRTLQKSRRALMNRGFDGEIVRAILEAAGVEAEQDMGD